MANLVSPHEKLVCTPQTVLELYTLVVSWVIPVSQLANEINHGTFTILKKIEKAVNHMLPEKV